MMKVFMIGIYLLLSSAGLILFKLGVNNNPIISSSQGFLNLKIGYLSLSGVVCYGCSFLLYLGLVSKYNLSYIIPITTGIMQIIILLASSIIFKETITFTQIIGVILVVIGVAFIN